MLLDMALGSKAPTSFRHRCQVTAALLLIVCVTLTKSAPTTYDEIEAKRTDLTDYFNDPNGCYYNYQHYEEGDRIVTNEPCLNCTCHNRMLMCYLRVCPFSKAIGQDCTVQKSPDQCCPVISCPEVPVHLLTSSTTQSTTTTTSTTTEVGWRDDYGCMMNENGFFPDGAQVPSDPRKPCELCYCIRNRTACVMQECTLHVEGCRPVYQDGVCCPVRYDCDYESEKSTTSAPQITGGLVFSTTSAPFDCKVNNENYRDGESIAMVTEKPCEHCYCMRGDIVCAVQDCGEPLRGKDCTPETPPPGQCCPTSYQCPNETMNSYDLTTLQPALLSDSDENEAEKYPSNDDVYEKLGENQPGQQDDTNDVNSEQAQTTAAYDNEIPPAGTSEQTTDKNEGTHDSVPENHNTAEGPNAVPESDGAHVNNEENKPEHSNAKPDSADQVSPVDTESDATKYESTGKPVEPTSVDEAQPTQSPAAADPSLNDNIDSPTTQTTAGENIINEENNNNESPVQSQDVLASSSPVQPTESSVESETQSSNAQDSPQEGVPQQTDAPVVAEKEPIQSSNDEHNVDIKSSTETTSGANQDPLNQSNEGSTENYIGENKIVTVAPLSGDAEQTTQQLIQSDNVNTPLGESNSQTDPASSNVDQNNSEQNSQDITQSPEEGNLPTDSPSNVEQNSLNNDKVQEENVFSTEIPKVVVNEPVENKPQSENKPESEITPTEKYQDNLQEGNVVPTEIPNKQNEPSEQTKPFAESDPLTEDGPELEITSTEQNQDVSHSENVSPTEIPKVENEPTELNKPLVDNGPQTENRPELVQTPVDANIQDSSHAENLSPTEQNKPLNENSPQTGDQPESVTTPTEQNQDSTQDENASPTEIPNVGSEPTVQSKPSVEGNQETESQTAMDQLPTGQNQDSINNENASPTQIPSIVNEPTEQNKPLVDSSPQAESQPESNKLTPTEQNQDGTQDENALPTEIPNVGSEPTEQNKPLVEGSQETESQTAMDQLPTGQNQDNADNENASPTQIPSIVNEPTEQNKPLEESSPQTENQHESDKTPVQPNQDSTQDENALPTEISNIESEPTEKNKPLVESIPQTESQTESDQSVTEQNQDSSHDENASPTEIPSTENEPTEQNKPLVDSSPQVESQPESNNLTPTEQNQDNVQGENVSPTELPKVGNQDAQSENISPTEIPKTQYEPTENDKPLAEIIPGSENKPESNKIPTEQNNQDSSQSENVSPTVIPTAEHEPVEQNNPQTVNQPESDKIPAEQNNQDSSQSENASPTVVPAVENEPVEQNNPQTVNQPESDKIPAEQNNQDSSQSENVSPTVVPAAENEPVEQNNPQTVNQPESDKIPAEQNNQDSSQSENVSPTVIPAAENEPVEQDKPLVENNPQTENPLESDKTPTEQNQDNVQENASPTQIPNIESEPTEQNKPLVNSHQQTESKPESDKMPIEQNQDSVQENASPTQIPNIESEPTEQNKPLIESSPQAENLPEPPKTLSEENQSNPQVESVSSTEIPSKLNEPQSENSVTENAPIQPVVTVNDVSTEHSIEDNNIFVLVPTSPSLLSENQVKGDEPTSISTGSDNSDKVTIAAEKNEDKIVENLPTSADDKTPSTENTNVNNASPISPTEIAAANNNVSPQTNDENAEHSTETKPVGNEVVGVEVSNDVTIAPVDSHEPTPTVTGSDNKLGSNDQVNSKPSAVAPTTESNYDVNSGITNPDVLVDDVSSQENDSVNGEDEGAPISDPLEPQIASQTESPTETESSTNEYPVVVNEPVNDVTTSLPKQQVTDNSIPVIPVEAIDPSEPVQTDDKTETPSVLSENIVPEITQDSHVPTEVSGVQQSDDISKPTDSPVLDPSGVEQSVPTQGPVQINENESVTPQIQSQDENVNEIGDQTSVYPDTTSNGENNSNAANGLIQNNVESSSPLSDKIETSTNAQSSGEEPVKNNDGVAPVENESSTVSQVEQVNQGSSENADNIETTNSYTELPSVASITNAPASIADENDANPSVNPSNDVETNLNNNGPANVVPQQSVNSDETSTQYNVNDVSTNGPIQESPNANVNSNVETSTNVPSYSEIPSEVNQDSVTESELYATQSPTEKNVLTVDSDKAPANDATMEAISNLPVQTNGSQTNTNEVINENPSESSDNADKPTVSKTPDYAIDITTISSSELPGSVSGSTEAEDQANAVNEATTSNIDKNSDATTEVYDNVQAGVPGEGSCLIDFVTYAHKAEVPKSNPCHEKCECLNSIVTCTSVNCPPAPPQHRNCIPLHPGNESWCCPTYMCEGGIEGVLFESNNQLGSPQLISTVVLEDKPGEENDDKTQVDEEVPSTPSPQIASEYNTLPPSQTDTNDDSQDSVGVTEVSAPSEIPNKPLENAVAADGDNDIPATTASLETIENDKPIENNKPVDSGDKPVESEQPSENEKPVENDQSSENEKPVESEQPSGTEKPVESDQPSENEKPVESDQPSENEKPIESDQTTENEKPSDDSEAGVTTVSYASNDQTVTNKPEVVDNVEGQNALPNAINESQDSLSPSTEVPSYESAVTNVILTNDEILPEQNSGSDDSVTATTYKPNDSIVDQQVDDNKTEAGGSEPTVDEKIDTVPVVAGEADLPASDVNPVEVTQIPTIIADANPTAVENNVNGLRPTSIDDIISSVNMVKDAVKNSLETSSKPAEIDYETTIGSVENYQPTVVPENAVDPSAENALVDKYEEPQTTASSVNIVPELQTDDVGEKLPESPAVTASSDEVAGSTQVPNISPSLNADQGVSTELPSNTGPDTQEIPTSPAAADANVSQPAEGTADDKISEVTTAQNSPSSAAGQDQTSDGPTVATSDPAVSHVDVVQSNTNLPEAVAGNDKTPEVTTEALPSFAQQEVLTDDAAANKPAAEQEKPGTASPIAQGPEAEVPTLQSATGHHHPSTAEPSVSADTSETDEDKRFGAPGSSSPAATEIGQDNKRPQESAGDMVNIPFDTEKPLPKPSSSSTPASAPPAGGKPSYTPIPQSTWTQKPFHQDSTSEAPQPDQGFPDEYDDENEAVYGPGTCRYGGKIYVSAQQVPREDPCDFCFCFRGDIICLQQSCPPPIFGCYQENIQGFCCPRYECPVAQATSVNVTTTTTTTTTMVPPHFFANAYRGAARRTGCLIHGHAYHVGEDVGIASGPCLECICGADGKMKCDPKPCSPEPMLRKIMAEAVDQRKR